MVYKQVFADVEETDGERKLDPKQWQGCFSKCLNRILVGDVEPKVIWNGTICKGKPNDRWTADVYVDFVVLSAEGVPRQAIHFQGESLKDLLKEKKKHYRHLQLQTKHLKEVLEQQMNVNSEEITRAGIVDPENGPWPPETQEGMTKELCGVVQLRTVLHLHQQRCNISKDDIKALQALLMQQKGAASAVPCIRKVFITPSWYEKAGQKLQRWQPTGAAPKSERRF